MIVRAKKYNPAYLVVILLVLNIIVVVYLISIEKKKVDGGVVDISSIEKKNELLKQENDSINKRIGQLEEEKIAFVRQIDSLQLVKGKIRKIYSDKYVQIDNYNSNNLLEEFGKYLPKE